MSDQRDDVWDFADAWINAHGAAMDTWDREHAWATIVSAINPDWVVGLSRRRRLYVAEQPLASRPAFSGWKPSTSFSGATAAYVDWSVRACEFKSSDKTRTLVEQAKTAGESRFSDRYVKTYASKELTEANASPAASQLSMPKTWRTSTQERPLPVLNGRSMTLA